MTLLTEPTRIVLAKGYLLPDDADAAAYITAVEAADGQALETATRMAINAFVKGCKADGIWPAIKASCILAGARTLDGALVPLVGAAPNSFNFVDANYDRKTGLAGNGSTTYLNSNRNNNADPRDSQHVVVYATTRGSNVTFPIYIGANTTGAAGSTQINPNTTTNTMTFRNKNSTANNGPAPLGSATGLLGMSRASSESFNWKLGSSSGSFSTISQTPTNQNFILYNTSPTPGSLGTNARLAFYSIGESLDLALLDARVTDLINDFGAAIP